MKNVILVLIITCLGFACQEIPEGYLFVENAGYSPDSMLVKTNLDTASVMVDNPDWDVYMQGYYDEFYLYYDLEDYIELLHQMGIYEEIKVKGEDYDRDRLNIPWVSTAIQGVEGTNPINMSIKHIDTDSGDVDKMLDNITVRNNGMFTIPCRHDVPSGRYVVSLRLEGPGYSADLDRIFTIIVR